MFETVWGGDRPTGARPKRKRRKLANEAAWKLLVDCRNGTSFAEIAGDTNGIIEDVRTPA